MTKIIKLPDDKGNLVAITIPDIKTRNFIQNHKITYLDIFYDFAHHYFYKINKAQWEQMPKKDKFSFVKKTMVELNNKVVSFKYFSEKLKNDETRLVSLKSRSKLLYDTKPLQLFTALSEAYLNTFHSIYDLIKDVDSKFNSKYYEKLKNEDWFKIHIDLRNILHHIESPLVTIDRKNNITISIERIHELKHVKYFKDIHRKPSGYIDIVFSSKCLGESLIDFLNEWAKHYLDKLPTDSKTFYYNYYRNGKWYTKDILLTDLMKMVAQD